MEEQLNAVDVDPFLRQRKNDEISRQENSEEKTFSETVLAVADRVYSRQGIARSILIQSVLVKIPFHFVNLTPLFTIRETLMLSLSN